MVGSVLIFSLGWWPLLTGPGSPASESSAADSAYAVNAPQPPAYRIERVPASGGSELITLFGRIQYPGSSNGPVDVPVLSILRDDLGSGTSDDPQTQRLRYVWILTSTRPTPFQRAASALSFLWFRAGTKHHANRVPKPVLDLAAPGKAVVPSLIGKSLQATELDPLGKLVRTSTRTYTSNSTDYRKLHLYQALGALDSLERSEQGREILPDDQLREIYSRLRLSDHTFGGLIREQKLSSYYEKENSRRQQTLGHNWELLRQRAEQEGLYFQPLALPDTQPSLALLWIARQDVSRERAFDRQFLNISNPWNDDRLTHWTGYTEQRMVEEPVPAEAGGGTHPRPVEMIPLALYSLDHPRVPLLLADFRNSLTPKRNEMVRRGATSVVTGVFGITRFGSWPFLVGDTTYTFVRARHGAAMDRSARLEAYSDARQFLAADTGIAPALKAELLHRVDHLAVNPLENGMSTETVVAKEQYAALVQYAQSPDGLARQVERSRRAELDSYTESRTHRFFASIGHLFVRRHGMDSQDPDSQMSRELASYRRAAYQIRFLERVASSPRPEVAWDVNKISESVETLSEAPASRRAAHLIARLFANSEDSDLRFTCLRALRQLDIREAHNELWRLSQDPNTAESWRAICLLYLNPNSAGGSVALAGGGQ